tara:strand:+ start:624 stop:1778 length:1155 start_codon:yes stop_codon:yes gene_type:complete
MTRSKVVLLLPLLFSLLLYSPNSSHSISDDDSHLPYWHYNNAKWWSEGKISDDEFLQSIIKILNESQSLINTDENKIPSWFATIAAWFSNYQINETEYLLIIEYLHSQNILKLSEPLISIALQEYNLNTFPLIQTFEKDVTLFEAGHYVKDKIFLDDGNSRLIDIQFNFKTENTSRYEPLKNSSNSVVVVPTFTFTAYTEPGFYTFYRGDCNEELHGKLFLDSNCLTIPINYNKPTEFTASTIGINILHLLDYPLITDIDVDKNPEILLNYDKVIMLHNEYVTSTMFDAITSHPNVIYLYPNALYAEIDVNYDDDTISLIRGHNYPDPLIRNGFDWKYDNSLLEYELECTDWKFEKIPNGHMLNCYPEYASYSDELLLRTLNEF